MVLLLKFFHWDQVLLRLGLHSSSHQDPLPPRSTLPWFPFLVSSLTSYP